MTAPLALIFLALGLSVALVFPFQTLFLTDAVQASPLQVTLFLLAAPLSSVLVSWWVGNFSDRRPVRRHLIIGTALAGAVAALGTAFARDFWVVLGLTVTATALAGAALPQLFAYARVSFQDAGRAAMAMSGLRTLFSLSWVAGPFLAALLLEAGTFTLVYGVAAGTYGLAALIAWRLLTNQQAAAAPVETAEPVPDDNAPRRVIVLSVAAFALLQCVTALTVQALPLFLDDELGRSVSDAGLLLGVCAALEIPLMLAFGFLSTRFSLRRLMLAGPVFTLAYALVVAFSSELWVLIAAQLVNAAGIAVVQGLGVSYMQELLPRQPGRASTLFTNAFPAGAMLAGPVLGLSQQVGYRTAYLTSAGLAVLALVLLLAARSSYSGQTSAVLGPLRRPSL
ncbi:sugar efflux transporter [Actinoplanes sp. TRM 88003]|uniref:Sugar efflux transporter n=1 Tax=Paractinoplanes aksuensis TaxID=2939490 RepID=A0ABT1DWF8_9ACTN|nr:sugar efflux transporter [Actinoplanes aksuensis]MCO8275189.1 sugar efflux transporter [Actinoplanes aksuensis]